jgi:hypothetical protein
MISMPFAEEELPTTAVGRDFLNRWRALLSPLGR